MTSRNQTVSIIIPAYNESRNILALLHDVLSQRSDKFTLKEIVVISDGSTDNMAQKVASCNSPLLHLIDSKERFGKYHWINHIYSTSTTDILVFLDADIRLADRSTIQTLVSPLLKDTSLAATCGYPVPYKPRNLIESCAEFGYSLYAQKRVEIGRTAMRYHFIGKILAIRRSFVAKLKIPADIADDVYLFYYLASHNYPIEFVQNAKIYFRLPATISDMLRQTARYVKTNEKRYFSKALIHKHSIIHPHMFFGRFIREALHRPLRTPGFAVLYAISRIVALFVDHKPKWSIIKSTKDTIVIKSSDRTV